jgi:hypothetical protein
MECCVACREVFDVYRDREYRASCGHEYCFEFFESRLRASLDKGLSLSPPACCGYDLWFSRSEDFKAAFPEDLRSQLAQRQEEHHSSNRTYYSVPTCSTLIGSSHTSGHAATCPACESVTCVAFKAPSHTGECPVDEALQKVLTTAVTMGWMSCSRCQSMIERIDGCDEMM